MNKYQRIIVIAAAVNIALMFLFPPFLDNPIRRGVPPSFEGFYFFFSTYGTKRIHNELLTLEVLFVVINVLLAWLLLDRRTAKGEVPEFRYTRATVLFLAGNLALLLAFPPFESYASLLKSQAPNFDGFYFFLGDKQHRNIFIPLLYLEIILVVINVLAIWLSFNALRRDELFAKQKILELAQALPPSELAEVSETLGYKALHPGGDGQAPPHLGAGPDRRKGPDPRYRGPERRKSGDRRIKTRTV